MQRDAPLHGGANPSPANFKSYKMPTESFKNRLSYMALADMDYLSARILIMSGLFLRGHATFADALEKLCK
jgi:hypothetical protein